MSADQPFESALERAHAVYNRLGVADIARLPVETAPAPRRYRANKGDPPLRILAQRQKADYYGTLGDNAIATGGPTTYRGRFLLIEAKADIGHNGKPKTSLAITRPTKRSSGRIAYSPGLKLHQLEALVAAADFGAVVAVVWCSGPPLREQRLVFTEPALRDALDQYNNGARKSLPASAGHEYAFELVGTDLIANYLETVIEDLINRETAAGHGCAGNPTKERCDG